MSGRVGTRAAALLPGRVHPPASSPRRRIGLGPALGPILGLAACLLAPALGQKASKQPPANDPQTFFEFGTVVALGNQTVDVQSFDEQRQRPVQHTFQLIRDTRADLVHLGDPVEVIFTANGPEYTLRRLLALPTGIPKAGPPGAAARREPSPPAAPAVVPKVIPIVPARSGPGRSSAPASSISLGGKAAPPPSNAINVPLGASPEVSAKVPRIKEVAHDTPSEECNRSSADWPAQPISLAVLDFRYPTEREESHDEGTTGGGSGTAVADLVFDRLDQIHEFALSRGDRRRLYKADFAGAARVGRQLGVDAVLAGTFVPIEDPQAEPGSAPRTYQLSAGIVDTCTGQLLLRLSSNTCTAGADSCAAATVTAKQAANPVAALRAFKPPLDALLYPLEHNGTPASQPGAAGIVTELGKNTLTLQLPAGVHPRPGDQLAVHASRLAKNPTTYTLQDLKDQEIGRATIQQVQASTATASYLGDIPPRIGDTLEFVPQP